MLIASERSGVTLLLPNRRLLLSALALEAAGSLRSPAAPYDGAPQQKRNALCRHSPPPQREVAMRRFLPAVLAVVVASNATAQGTPAANQEIRKQVAAFQAAFNKQDAAGMAAVYAPDGDAMIGDGPYDVGAVGLTKRAREEIAARAKGLEINITVTDVRFLTADVAVANARAHFNVPEVRDDRGTWVFVHRDGKWMVAALRVQPAQKQ